MKTLAYRIHRPAAAAAEVMWVGIALGVGCVFGFAADHIPAAREPSFTPAVGMAVPSAAVVYPSFLAAAIVATDHLRSALPAAR